MWNNGHVLLVLNVCVFCLFAGDAEGFREEYLHQEAVEVDPVSFRFFLHSPCSSDHRIISQECRQFLGQNAHLVLEHQAGLHHKKGWGEDSHRKKKSW